jgi:hypothetical protein
MEKPGKKTLKIVSKKSNFLVSLINRIQEFPRYSRPDLIKFLATICAHDDEPLYASQAIILR